MRASPLLALAVLGMTPAGHLLGQSPCDPELQPRKGDLGYRPRGDRCEGLYIKDVGFGGTTLAIVSLTSRFEEYDPLSDDNLHLEWFSPDTAKLRIQVRGIQPKLYFGMDSDQPGRVGAYRWPTSLLAQLNILQPDIGVLAWTRIKAGKRWLTVHVPVSITRTKNGGPPAADTVVLYSIRELSELYLTIGPADALGQPVPGGLIKNREPQGLGWYPPKVPIRLALPPLGPPGLYYLLASATLLDNTGTDAEPILINVPAPAPAADP
jgi:hypothetical protein